MAITLDGTNGINSSGVIVAPDGSASAPSITNDGDTNTGIFFPAADTIGFAEGGVEHMRLEGGALRLYGNGTGSVSGAGILDLIRPETEVTNGDHLGTIRFFGLDTTSNLPTQLAFISAEAFDTHAAGDNPTMLVFGATPDGSETVQSMWYIAALNASGSINSAQFLAGTSATAGGMNIVGDSGNYGRINVYKGTDSGTGSTYVLRSYYNNTAVGGITSSSTATALVTSSDYRLKENIAPITGALNRVAQLNPVTFNWISDGSSSEGFIAHELAEVVPQAVVGEKDGVDDDGNPEYQAVDTNFLVATLTAAIQELKAINDAQASRIETLEAKVAALEANT